MAVSPTPSTAPWWPPIFEGKKVFTGGENSIAVFSINQTTGEPTLIQTADGHGNYLRTFNVDPSGKLLIAAPLWRCRSATATPSRRSRGLVLYRVGNDGKLTFVRKYDNDADEKKQQFLGRVGDAGLEVNMSDGPNRISRPLPARHRGGDRSDARAGGGMPGRPAAA